MVSGHFKRHFYHTPNSITIIVPRLRYPVPGKDPNTIFAGGARAAAVAVVLKDKGLWLQDSKSWPRFYMYIYFQIKAAPPYYSSTFEAGDVYKTFATSAFSPSPMCTISTPDAISMFASVCRRSYELSISRRIPETQHQAIFEAIGQKPQLIIFYH